MGIAIPIIGFVLLGAGAATYLIGAPAAVGRRFAGVRLSNLSARLFVAVCGASPILTLSIAYATSVPLTALLGFIVLPAYVMIMLLGRMLPDIGRAAMTGFLAGIVAVLVYDLMRLALSFSQGGADPIPHIGHLLAGDGAPWWLGYVWRTLGNGAGLGVVYAVLCPRQWWGPLSGLLYASMVGLGMLTVLWLFPQVQDELFRLTWQTAVNSALGHATYGLMLGFMARLAVPRGRHVRIE